MKTKTFLRLVVPSARALRVAAYATCVFGALATLAARSVQADAREVALGVGHELATLEDLTGGAYHVRINGASVRRASTRTEQSVAEVLDRYEAYCAASPSVLGQAMRDIPEALADRAELPKGDPLRDGIVRQEEKSRGMVACFSDEGARGATLGARLAEFGKTRDLAAFGRFHYAYAERTKGGTTRVVTFWSEGALPISEMFPASGDAPGTDSAIAPRPPGSRRTFSASVDEYPAGVRIYETRATRGEVLAGYDAALAKQGFRKAANGDAVGYLHDDGPQIILSLTERKGITTATLIETRGQTTAVKAEGSSR